MIIGIDLLRNQWHLHIYVNIRVPHTVRRCPRCSSTSTTARFWAHSRDGSHKGRQQHHLEQQHLCDSRKIVSMDTKTEITSKQSRFLAIRCQVSFLRFMDNLFTRRAQSAASAYKSTTFYCKSYTNVLLQLKFAKNCM